MSSFLLTWLSCWFFAPPHLPQVSGHDQLFTVESGPLDDANQSRLRDAANAHVLSMRGSPTNNQHVVGNRTAHALRVCLSRVRIIVKDLDLDIIIIIIMLRSLVALRR